MVNHLPLHKMIMLGAVICGTSTIFTIHQISGATLPPPPPGQTAVVPTPQAPGAIPLPGGAGGDVASSQFGWTEGAPQLDESKKGLAIGADQAILQLFAQGNVAIKAMDDTVAQMDTMYAEIARKYLDINNTLDTVLQQASFNLGTLKKTDITEPSNTQAKALEASQKEQQLSVDQINKAFEQIKQLKKQLQDIFLKANDNISQSKTLINQARQKNLQLLSQPNLAAGQPTLAEINQIQQSLMQMFTQFQNATINSFNTTFDSLNGTAQNMNTLIQKLQAKDFNLQVTQEQQQQQQTLQQKTTQQAQAQKTAFTNWLIPEQEPTQVQPAQEATFIHYALKRVADFLTAAISMGYSGYLKTKEFVTNKLSSLKAPSTQPQPTQPQQPPAQDQVATPQPTPPTPTAPPAPMQPTPTTAPQQPQPMPTEIPTT